MKHPSIALTTLLCLAAGLAAQTPRPAATRKAGVAPAKPAAGRPAAAPRLAAPKAKPAPGSPKPAAGPAVVTVGDRKIDKEQFELLLKSLPPQVQARFQTPDQKKQFAKDLSELFALAQEAEKRGLANKPQLQAQLDIQRSQMLANTLMQELMEATPVDDAALRKYFDDNKGQYEQVAGRHILVRFKGSPVPVREGQQDLSEEEALAKASQIRDQIGAGADFAEVAKKESDDAGSGSNGGSLGTFGRGQMVPEFEKAAFSLAVGQLSEPVRSQFGYHVIQIQEQKHQTFEDAKSAIEQRLRPEKARELADQIKKGSGIQIDDAYFAAPQ